MQDVISLGRKSNTFNGSKTLISNLNSMANSSCNVSAMKKIITQEAFGACETEQDLSGLDYFKLAI